MKLVVIGPVYPFRGGISHFTTQLSHALIDHKHEVHIFSFRRQYPGWLYPGVSDKETGQSIDPIDAQYILDPIYPWTWKKTAAEIKNTNPDVVLIHWWTTFWSIAYWSLARQVSRSGLKIMYLIHNVAPHEPLPWDNWLAKKVLKTGEAHIVQSANEKQRLDELIPGSNSILCPHPIYTQFSNNTAISKEEARHRLGINNEQPLILFFGIVRQYKGLKFALNAISILKEESIPVRMLVAGEFWEDIKEYEDMIIHLGITDQVDIYDRYIPNEDVGLFYSAADIFIAPYIGGTQSGSIKIAMSFNLPIVATDCISDGIMLNSDLVHVVPSKDSKALADAIKEFISGEFRERSYDLDLDSSWDELITTIEILVGK